MNSKKIVLIDMDGVIVDLQGHIKEFSLKFPEIAKKYGDEPDHIPGIFRNPKPIEGAIEAIKKLHESGKYELIIATSASWGNPYAASDKRFWIEEHFGDLFYKKMIITHRKDLLIGDYLIDDRDKNGAGDFKGKLIDFGYNHITDSMNTYKTWDDVLKFLLD